MNVSDVRAGFAGWTGWTGWTRHQRVKTLLVAIVGSLTGAAAGSAFAQYDDGAGNSVIVSEDGIAPSQTMPLDAGNGDGWSESSGGIADGGAHEAFTAAPSGAGTPFRPTWGLAVDALMLWQGNAQSLPLLLTSSGGAAINAQNLQTETGAGARIGLIREVGDCHAIEGNYFQARPFNATGYAPAAGGPYTLANMGDIVFDDVTSATMTTSGWIQSAELNWRKNVCYSPITWLAGFRWVELNSSANVDYAFSNPDPDAYGNGEVNTDVGNNLYGGQMGADIRLWNRGGRWRVNGIGKAGVFYNSASYQRSSGGFIKNNGEVISLGTVSATADQTAFFGELGLNSTFWVTNWLAWRAGYTVMWASGVAVAPQQLPLNNFGDQVATINTESSVLLHGVTTGIEARW